jgi:hypothetical protein
VRRFVERDAAVIGATLRFKVDRLLRPVGYRQLDYEGNPLPLAAQHLHGEPVQLMCLAERAQARRKLE